MSNFIIKGEFINSAWLSLHVRSLLVRAFEDATEAAGTPTHVREDALFRLILMYTENERVLRMLTELGVTIDALKAWRDGQR